MIPLELKDLKQNKLVNNFLISENKKLKKLMKKFHQLLLMNQKLIIHYHLKILLIY